MSKTKRRKQGDYDSYEFPNYHTPRIEIVLLIKNGSIQRVKKILTKKEAKKKLAKYHADSGTGFTSNRHKFYSNGCHEQSLRIHTKTELKKYEKFSDYEVQIQTKKYLRDWWN